MITNSDLDEPGPDKLIPAIELIISRPELRWLVVPLSLTTINVLDEVNLLVRISEYTTEPIAKVTTVSNISIFDATNELSISLKLISSCSCIFILLTIFIKGNHYNSLSIMLL